MNSRAFSRAGDRAGFTLLELIMGVVLSTLVLAAVFQMVFAQNRMYARQQGLADASQSLRSAGTLLAWELRHVSASEGDLYAVAADSVSLRSFDGFGVICLKRLSQKQYGLHSVSGDIQAGDSAVLYAVNTHRPVDDAWSVVRLERAESPATLALTGTCTGWTTAPAPELGIELDLAANSDTAGLRVGAPVRAFRRRTYRMIQYDGQSWLGVRQGNGGYRLLTGPLRAGDGLAFEYFDAAGNPTTIPANVRAVEFILRTEAQLRRTADDLPEDSVVMRVQLRG